MIYNNISVQNMSVLRLLRARYTLIFFECFFKFKATEEGES